MTDNTAYSQNLDAAVRRSAGVNPHHKKESARHASQEAALRLRRERRKAAEKDEIDDDDFLDLDDSSLELTEEELREYRELLSDINEEEPVRSTPKNAQHSLGINGAESLGGAYTNEKIATGRARNTDKDAVNELLKSAHRDEHHQNDREGGAEESEKTKKEKKQRELVAKIFVSAIVIAMMAAAFWPG